MFQWLWWCPWGRQQRGGTPPFLCHSSMHRYRNSPQAIYLPVMTWGREGGEGGVRNSILYAGQYKLAVCGIHLSHCKLVVLWYCHHHCTDKLWPIVRKEWVCAGVYYRDREINSTFTHISVWQLSVHTYPVAAYCGKVLVFQEPVKLHPKEWLSMVFLQLASFTRTYWTKLHLLTI